MINLPELPEPNFREWESLSETFLREDHYNAAQMHAYATQAVEQDRAGRAGVEAEAARFRHIRSVAKRDGREGGWWGYWVLPFFAGWDHTPYSKSRGMGYDHVTFDDAVDAAIASQGDPA